MHDAENTRTVKNAGRFGSGIIISRLLGLLRDMLLAIVLGGGWAADIFLAAFRIPNFARRLVHEGSMAMAFMPFFNRLKNDQGTDEAFAFGRAAILQFLIGASIVTLLCIWGSHTISMLLVPGFAGHPLLMDLTGELMEITFFYLPLICVAAIMGSMLLSLGHYFTPSLAMSLLNVSMIGAGGYALITGQDGLEAARIFSYSVVIGGAMQAAVMYPQLHRAGFRLLGRMAPHDADTKSFRRKAPQTVFGSASYQLGAVIAMFMASFLGEGNVTALYLAERILEFPLALVGIALGTASIGNFSHLVITGQRSELRRQMRQIISIGLCFSLPAAFGLLALAWPIMESFFFHGNFGSNTLELTVRALVFYTPLIPAVVIGRPMLAALNASGRATTTMAVSLFSLAVLIFGTIFLLNFFTLEAITISSSLAAWVNTGLLAVLMQRCKVCCEPGEKPGGIFPWKSFAGYLCLSLAMFAALMLLQMGLDQIGLGRPASVAIGVPCGAALYLGMCNRVKSPDLKIVLDAFR
ncbi:murein biosynthesis integral membrane protein MurJ, partial [Desulfovibrio sp. OttesenSCG-928-C06]|nr:murein biosynthesis integral membrane protein MurJ [Desulfovibrio sp. OttesenSCG-928-C06]